MRRTLIALSNAGLLAACTHPALVIRTSPPRSRFEAVTGIARAGRVGDPDLALTAEEVAAVEGRVRQMAHGRAIASDSAVRIARVDNRGLQAS